VCHTTLKQPHPKDLQAWAPFIFIIGRKQTGSKSDRCHLVHCTVLFMYSTSDGLQPDEAVSVQSQRIEVALALEEARKIAPFGKLCVKVLAFLILQ